jgi:Domain of unknown function (DUF6249)
MVLLEFDLLESRTVANYSGSTHSQNNATDSNAGLSHRMQRKFRAEEVVMEPTVLFTLLCLAVVIAFFSFLAVAMWARDRRREREAYYKSETLKKIVEAQEPAANATLEFLREQERVRARRTREGLKLGGLVTIAVGLSFFLVLWATGPSRPAYIAGFIPFLIGLALLAYTYLLAPKD